MCERINLIVMSQWQTRTQIPSNVKRVMVFSHFPTTRPIQKQIKKMGCIELSIGVHIVQRWTSSQIPNGFCANFSVYSVPNNSPPVVNDDQIQGLVVQMDDQQFIVINSKCHEFCEGIYKFIS